MTPSEDGARNSCSSSRLLISSRRDVMPSRRPATWSLVSDTKPPMLSISRLKPPMRSSNAFTAPTGSRKLPANSRAAAVSSSNVSFMVLPFATATTARAASDVAAAAASSGMALTDRASMATPRLFRLPMSRTMAPWTSLTVMTAARDPSTIARVSALSATMRSSEAVLSSRPRSPPSPPALPSDSMTLSKADFTRNSEPFRLSSMISATRLAVPPALSSLMTISSMRGMLEASTSNAGPPRSPKISSPSAVEIPASLRRRRASIRPTCDILTSSVVTPRVFRILTALIPGDSSSARIRRRPVPAMVACRPASLRALAAAVTSSRRTPRPAATGATNFIAWPSCSTVVLELLAAFASTSTTRPVWLTSSRNPFRMLEAMSAARPSSSAPACASCRVPSMVPSTWLVSKPARARNSMPSAACVAVNLVVAPRALAFSLRSTSTSPVASVMAWTVDIA